MVSRRTPVVHTPKAAAYVDARLVGTFAVTVLATFVNIYKCTGLERLIAAKPKGVFHTDAVVVVHQVVSVRACAEVTSSRVLAASLAQFWVTVFKIGRAHV